MDALPLNTVVHDHVMHFCGEALPPESVQACVTSSPYFGVRSYGTVPLVWGGDPTCSHNETLPAARRPMTGGHGAASAKQTRNQGSQYGNTWVDVPPVNKRGQAAGATAKTGNTKLRVCPPTLGQGAFCAECGAWRGELGQEPLHDCLAWARGEPPCPRCFVCHQRMIGAAIWRVLKPDGVYLLNLGDTYAGSWGNYGTRDGKQRGDRSTDKWARPAYDGPSGFTARPATSRVPLPEKSLIGIPWRTALALQADGWTLRNDLIWAKGNPMPESVTDRHTRAHEFIFHLVKSPRYFWNQEAIREHIAREWDGGKNGANKVRHLAGSANSNGHTGLRETAPSDDGKRNPRSVLTINVTPSHEAHYASYPLDLPRRLIRASTREGDVVLEPFAGSGTTCLVALQEGRNFVACEWAEHYIAIAEKRIARETGWARRVALPLEVGA